MKNRLVPKPTVISQLHQEIRGDEVSVISLRNFVNSWLQRESSAAAPPTFAFYRNTVNRFLAFLLLGGVTKLGLPEITREHITRFRSEEAKWSTPKTVNREVKLLRMILRAARCDASVVDDAAAFADTIRIGLRSNEFADILATGPLEKTAHGNSDNVGPRRGRRILGTEQIVGLIRPTTAGDRNLRVHEESLFLDHADCWVIRYHGETALLKRTRGLGCLAVLLHDPGREFHVSELIARPMVVSTRGAGGTVPRRVTSGLSGGFPILDSQAKAEYKRRLNELRQDLAEAERLNDFQRRTEAQTELKAIAHHLASAVGLGRRDRRTSSDAERARSAVTKCIRKAIRQIGNTIPSLGCHLAGRIKTGYFCSYNPHPERPVSWKF
jgi:hypothetical protein